MTLFLILLFFLVFDSFFFTFNNIVILYIIYISIYFFSNRDIIFVIPNNLFNYKLFFFKLKFFFFKFFSFSKNFLNFWKKPNLIWKPLFKKSSYFGLYRSNRNQWLNK